MEFWEDRLRCPVCGAPVTKRENSLLCAGERLHCFDFSADGYVNLASAKESGGGDDAALVAARTAFLGGDHYKPFADALCAYLTDLPQGGVAVDAGCGEGYYTCRFAREGTPVVGFDLSKRGVRAAARTAAREHLPALFAVAGIFNLPLRDASVDAVFSIFAPIAEKEFSRVLKPGGLLITAGAGPDHLLGMKRILYEEPRRNTPRLDRPRAMKEIASRTVRFDMELQKEAVAALFAMTPYYYRTAPSAARRLLALPSLTTEAEMEIHVYQK